MNTPSKKVTYFLICSATIVTSIITYSIYQNKKPEIVVAEIVEKDLSVVVNNQYENVDTDADGLLDWEETLWNTNPRKADSDNDGTKDGQEVALSRDPNKAGPDDIWNNSNFYEDYIVTTNAPIDSLTNRVAQDLLIAATKGVGSDGVNAATEKLLKQIKESITVSDIYKKDNLITFDETNKEKLQIYANQFLNIPLDEIKRVLKLPADEHNYAEAFKTMSLSLSVIPVPNSLAGLHTNFINNLNKMSVYMEVIQDGELDPVKMTAVAPEYVAIQDNQKIILEQIKNYMESNGIIFTENAE
jgi:hypothetical protein